MHRGGVDVFFCEALKILERSNPWIKKARLDGRLKVETVERPDEVVTLVAREIEPEPEELSFVLGGPPVWFDPLRPLDPIESLKMANPPRWPNPSVDESLQEIVEKRKQTCAVPF